MSTAFRILLILLAMAAACQARPLPPSNPNDWAWPQDWSWGILQGTPIGNKPQAILMFQYRIEHGQQEGWSTAIASDGTACVTLDFVHTDQVIPRPRLQASQVQALVARARRLGFFSLTVHGQPTNLVEAPFLGIRIGSRSVWTQGRGGVPRAALEALRHDITVLVPDPTTAQLLRRDPPEEQM